MLAHQKAIAAKRTKASPPTPADGNYQVVDCIGDPGSFVRHVDESPPQNPSDPEETHTLAVLGSFDEDGNPTFADGVSIQKIAPFTFELATKDEIRTQNVNLDPYVSEQSGEINGQEYTILILGTTSADGSEIIFDLQCLEPGSRP